MRSPQTCPAAWHDGLAFDMEGLYGNDVTLQECDQYTDSNAMIYNADV